MILQNEIRCRKCNHRVYSRNRHDFVSCKCGAVAVDGGLAYLRRVADDLTDIHDLSISIPDESFKKLEKAIDWASDTRRNKLGLICALMRTLRDEGLLKRTTDNEKSRAPDASISRDELLKDAIKALGLGADMIEFINDEHSFLEGTAAARMQQRAADTYIAQRKTYDKIVLRTTGSQSGTRNG